MIEQLNNDYKRELLEKDQEIEKLQDEVKRLSKCTVQKYDKNTNFGDIERYASFMTEDHVYRMADGLARFAVEYPFKDVLSCSDTSRKTLVYTAPDNTIHRDCRGRHIIQHFFRSFKDKIFEHKTNIDKKHEKFYSDNAEELIRVKVKFGMFIAEVNNASKGNDTQLGKEFVRHLCAICT
jgi:hypothetical protein